MSSAKLEVWMKNALLLAPPYLPPQPGVPPPAARKQKARINGVEERRGDTNTETVNWCITQPGFILGQAG